MHLQPEAGVQQLLKDFQLNHAHDVQLQLVQSAGIMGLQQRILPCQGLTGGAESLHVLGIFGNHLHGDQRRA